MKKSLFLIFVLYLLSGCSTLSVVEYFPEEERAEQRPYISYEVYTSGYRTCDIGHCVICGANTSSGSIKYCKNCWFRRNY